MACLTIEDVHIDTLARINAMRWQEVKTKRSRNYLNPIVNASCRKAMVDWCFIVADSFGFSRETVGIAMSTLDRYLSSGECESAKALRNKQTFQLAAITSFYLAIKLHEPVQLGLDVLIDVCRGFYTKGTILATEQDILRALEWRVCVSTPTPMEYVRQLLKLLPKSTSVLDVVEENATKHAECATSDVAFSICRASAVGIACLAGAMNDAHDLTSVEKDLIWSRLSTMLDFDVASDEIRRVERLLLANSACREPRGQLRACLPRAGVKSANEQQSSPISVAV